MSAKRGPRVTSEQIEYLLDFLEKNRILISGKTHPLKTNEVHLLWVQLTNEINQFKGPKKTVEEWKRFFIELKSKTKKKARDVSCNLTQTGGGGYPKHLTELEEKLISLIGWVSVIGNSELTETVVEEPFATTEYTENVGEDYQQSLNESEKEINEKMPEEIIIEVNTDENCEKENVTYSQNAKEKVKILPGKKRKKSNIEKQKTYTSSANLLQDSAKIYSESSKELSAAINNMANSVNSFAESINTLAESIKFYGEVISVQNGII